VLELKRVDVEAGETVEEAIEAALTQIRERDYAMEVQERGALPPRLTAMRENAWRARG
jgi:citrate lyase gamma subunit